MATRPRWQVARRSTAPEHSRQWNQFNVLSHNSALQNLIDVAFGFVIHENDMMIEKVLWILAVGPVLDGAAMSRRNDPRIERHLGIFQTLLFDLFDRLVKLNFGVLESSGMAHAMWIEKIDVLLVFLDDPENEVGIESAFGEKGNPFPSDLVAQQI